MERGTSSDVNGWIDIRWQNNQRTEDKARPAMVEFDVLDCPVCMDPLTSPVVQCENGHLACSSCCPKLKNQCPTCASPIGHIRCRAMEAVLEVVFVACQNIKFGCTHYLSYGNETIHEKDCNISEILPPTTIVNDPISGSGSTSQPHKRGRGHPLKPKPAAPQEQQLINDQPKRGPDRPRKDGAATAPIIQASLMGGRQRKPTSVSATVSIFPNVATGARRRGRPRRVDAVFSTVAALEGGQVVAAMSPGIKRGRGRPPKRGRGRPAGRLRKNATSVTTGTQDSAELKRMFQFCKEKVKEIVNVLKAGVTSENQAVPVIQCIKDLEGLTATETVEQ